MSGLPQKVLDRKRLGQNDGSIFQAGIVLQDHTVGMAGHKEDAEIRQAAARVVGDWSAVEHGRRALVGEEEMDIGV
ncbi:MAG: hypothetical protein E6Q63_03830, partial [Novosphingobium sp.]